MLNRVSLLVVVGTLLVTTAAPVAADIVVHWDLEESDAEILSPLRGAVYEVSPCSATVTVEATATTTMVYAACASLDLYGGPFEGEPGTGGTLTHWFEFVFDGVTVEDSYVRTIDDAEHNDAGQLIEAWEDYSLTVGPDVLSITLDVGVGIHSVRLVHKVYDDRLEIHSSVNDFLFFYVICVPEPATLTMVGAALLVGGVRLRRRRRTSVRN